jgi:hypothetical protein
LHSHACQGFTLLPRRAAARVPWTRTTRSPIESGTGKG